ncbi:hypothetical protein [Blautia hansenii]|uniref:hypothetical protein n=1 Tax=Blautia hansenii TaxID=1322 RepID=UPI0039842AC8
MQKIVLNDKTELEILAGASIGSTTITAKDFTALGTIAQALTKAGNLDSVQFKQEEQVIGNYEDLKLTGPLFTSVDQTEGKVLATISLREKTETEKQLELLSHRSDVTEEALQEVILNKEV